MSSVLVRRVTRLLRHSRPLYQAVECSTQPLTSDVQRGVDGHGWHVVAGVCVQRVPTLSRLKNEVERKYADMKDQIRMERSKLSDFELEAADHLRRKTERDRRALEEDLDETQAAKLGGFEEFEELQESRDTERNSFTPAGRESEADREGDMKSPQRQRDRVLYLLVKKARELHSWQMPQGGVENEESLIEACKRELSEECGAGFVVQFLSGAPLAHLSYKHPQQTAGGILGTKVFFLRAQWLGGRLELNEGEGLVDHIWVTKEEMRNYVSPDYFTAVAPMLTT